MRKLLIFISLLVGTTLNAQTKDDFKECVEEFFDNLTILNLNLLGDRVEIDKDLECQRKYQGEFFDFNDRHDVRLNVFLTYYKTYVLGHATVTHEILDLDFKATNDAPESQSYRLSNVKIGRTFEDQSSLSYTSLHYSDTISCNMLVTWMGENANPRIRINGISYTEPLEKNPQVIAIRQTPILKVSNSYNTVSSHSGSHHVSVISYCDTESIYTDGSSKLIHRDTLEFNVIGNKYEIYKNEVKLHYSSNPNRHERILRWTLEQNETGETCEIMVIQEKRKFGIF